MKSYIKYIGVIDKTDQIHFVEFTQGVNVITGKSSTGKSAMIEIFDYCFGSSNFTIPSGVITDNSQYYFLVINIEESYLTIARTENSKNVFLKVDNEIPDISNYSHSFFESSYYSKDFNVELGHYLGLCIDDTDEDLEDRIYRKFNAKKSRPSIRNMTPFILQHQNLIANKHSLFYRFDQKEKREQTIEQFKIFSGFVTQEFFTIKQEIAEFERELKKLEHKQINDLQIKDKLIVKLDNLLIEYYLTTGNHLFNENSDHILLNPQNYIDLLKNKYVNPNYVNDKIPIEISKLIDKREKLYSLKKELWEKSQLITSSINYAKNFSSIIRENQEIKDANITASNCPFCNTKHEKIYSFSNDLLKSINWLNDELNKTHYQIDSFESDRKCINAQIRDLSNKIKEISYPIKAFEEKTSNEQYVPLYAQSARLQGKVEHFLQNNVVENTFEVNERISFLQKEISTKSNELQSKFNVNKLLLFAEKYINNAMNSIANEFDFEESYKPLNLHFELESFDLYHYDNRNKKKIYLRSMGSGANWLYSHLSLFLALNKYFCALGSRSLIPSILFLDQPTQVYFPTSVDNNENEFDARLLKKLEGKEDKLDDDIKSVTNIFNQLVKYCKDTEEETGILPQIIVTDHADNLKLDDTDFDLLVNNRRWRKKGFIDLDKIR